MRARFAVTVLATALLVALAGAAGAQLQKLKGTTPEFRAGLQTDMMKQRLELTPEQLPQVEKINLEAAQALQPIIDGDEGALREMREARGIQAKRDTALGKVLTPAQMTKYEAQKDEMRQKLMDKMLAGAAQ
jgi:Spy/CpxP family protein refolding chaperone